VARAAVLGRLNWLVADVLEVRDETATARTLVLHVPGWPGHLPGQHVDLRLTAEDGYQAQRSYSIASAAAGPRLELTVHAVDGGEVSPYLVGQLAAGDQVELRGPVGGYFVWRPEWAEPVLLLAGGSGVVPLMSMVRARGAAGAPMRMLYSVRSPADVIYRAELAAPRDGLSVRYAWTRLPAAGEPAGRVDAAALAAYAWPAAVAPRCYLCGPTGFVEAMADLLVAAGHEPGRVRTERFG
jgi:ferredoxin-NADP reductase